MIKLSNIILILGFLSTTIDASRWTGAGHVHTIATIMQQDASQQTIAYQYSQVQARIKYQITPFLKIHSWLDIESYWANTVLADTYIESINQHNSQLPLRIYKQIYTSDHYRVSALLKRAYAVMSFSKSDLSYGLQRFPIGVGTIWRPSDIINQYNPLNTLSADRLGLVGILYKYYISSVSQWQIMASHSSNQITNKGGRWQFNHNGMDIAGTFIRNEKVEMIGIDIIGALGKTGVNLYSDVALNQTNKGNRYILGVVGMDTLIKPNISTVIEVYYNGNKTKTNHSKNYQQWQHQSPYYVGNKIQIQLTPLLTLSNTIMTNLTDASSLLLPIMRISLMEEWDGLLGGSLSIGRDGSEFKHFPRQIYMGVSSFF